MTTTVLKPSSENIPEITTISLRTLKDSTTIAAENSATLIDCSINDFVRLNLLSDTHLTFSGGMKDGQQIVVAIVQADTTPHVVTYSSNVSLGYDVFSFPVLSETIGKLDRLAFMYDAVANTYNLVGYSRGY